MRLDHEVLELEPEHPFRISRSSRRSVRRVAIRLRHGGLEGRGEADPSGYYGEDADTVVRALEAMRPALEDADDPEALVPLERELARRARALAAEADAAGPPPGAAGRAGDDARAGDAGSWAPPDRRAPHAAARAGVAAALADLWGKRLGRPLWRLWGLDPGEAPPSSFTLGLDEPEAMARKARAARGWPILKVKLGVEREREAAILDAVRSEAPDAVLRVDANGGWTAPEAVERVAWLADLGVELVEQPLPPEDLEGLARVREASPVPVVVDESCVTAADVPGLVGAADGVNVKLSKCGGPLAALRLVHTARACGLDVMLGCMLSTSLGIAPAAHLAPLVDWADLDGAHLLADDPFRGPGPAAPGSPAAREAGGAGRITMGAGPGLGVEERGAG